MIRFEWLEWPFYTLHFHSVIRRIFGIHGKWWIFLRRYVVETLTLTSVQWQSTCSTLNFIQEQTFCTQTAVKNVPFRSTVYHSVSLSSWWFMSGRNEAIWRAAYVGSMLSYELSRTASRVPTTSITLHEHQSLPSPV